jgi:hypothetical protein
MMKMTQKEDYLTNTPKKEKVTIENGNRFPNLKNVAGDSVDEHKSFEEANITTITEDEIRQQNENL